MSWTYDVTTNRGKVRLLIGDTDTNDQKLQDAEVDYFLTTYSSNIYFSAAAAAEAIASKYGNAVSKSIGSTSVSLGDRQAHYLELAKALRATVRQEPVTIFQGGQTESGKETYSEDEDLVQPFFERRQDDLRSSVSAVNDFDRESP